MKVVANKETEVFASARIMYETQHLLDENRYPGQSDFQNSVRLSLFLSATYKLLDFVKFSGNIVLQPKVDDPGDIRMIPTGGVKVPFNKYFSYFIQANYMFESEPPANIVNYDLTVRQGLSLSYQF